MIETYKVKGGKFDFLTTYIPLEIDEHILSFSISIYILTFITIKAQLVLICNCMSKM